MDIYQLSLIFVPPLCAMLGFVGKYLLDKRSKHLETLKQNELNVIESNLKHFYYPIHSNLKRENIIWKKIIAFFTNKDLIEDPNLLNQFYQELDKEMLKLHLENQQIIKERFVEICIENKELQELLLSYDEHVVVYQIIRKLKTENSQNINEMLWPAKLGSPYPEKMLECIEEKINSLDLQRLHLMHSMV
jgi:hypothetical protein